MKTHPFFVGALMLTLAPVVSKAVVLTFVATLDGPSESPPVASPGIGTATVVYDSVLHTLTVSASFSGLVGTTTQAHIHAPTATPLSGTAGVATQIPSFIGFPLGVSSGVYSNTIFDLTLPSSFNPAFITAHGDTASAEAALLDYISGGRAYFNIHTTFATGGEIRGFLVPAAVPEGAGSTAWLFVLGLAPLLALRRRAS